MSPRAITATFAATGRQHRGMTMIEVMIAAVIVVIVVIGTSVMFVSGRKYIVDQQFYREAAQLASQKLEELKADGYDKVLEGDNTDQLTFNSITYQRQTQIALTSAPSVNVPKPCKKVTVTISWSIVHANHKAILVTYIGP